MAEREWEQRDIVCLHLDAHVDAREQSPAPAAVTAAGIGDALELGDAAVGRVRLLDDLAALEADGLVTAEERPVADRDAPRTVYVPTDAGREHAAEVREAVGRESVVVTDGVDEEVPLAEIGRYFDDEPAPLVTALARRTDDGRVPLEDHVEEQFVDREAALATVVDAVAGSFTRGSRTVVVEGVAGMGKTALVREATDRVAADREDLVLARGAAPAGVADPYTPVRQALEAVPDDGDTVARLADARSTSAPDDPEKLRAQRTALFDDVAEGLRAAASDHPVVLFLDNLQWADEASLELFAHLATTIDEWVYPVAFVGACRTPAVAAAEHPLPDVLERVDEAGITHHVTLDPLERADTSALLSGMVGRGRLPEGFVDLVHDRTGGNPLFVRETATHLLETGQVDPDAGAFPTGPEEVALPPEVTKQIDQRLSRLDDASRELLRLGAVLGERIPLRVLAAASDLSPARRREYLDVLLASGLWKPVGSEPGAALDSVAAPGATADGEHLQFASGGVREAVADRLSPERARELNRRVADALVDVHGGDDDQAARIAHHYEAASDAGTAIDYYRRAGDQAGETYAHEDAVDSYERALVLARERDAATDAERAAIHADIADVHRSVGEFEAARETIQDGLAVAPADSRERCRLLGTRAETLLKQGAYDEAGETARRQWDLSVEVGASVLEAEALRILGNVGRSRGEYDRAREQFRRSLDVAREVDDRRPEMICLKDLGTVVYRQGDDDRAREYFRRSLDIARDCGDRRREADNLGNLGLVAKAQGEYDRAQEYFQRTLDAARDLGHRETEAKCRNNLGILSRKRGENDRAREYFEGALDVARDLDARHLEARCLNNLGLVTFDAGETGRAREYQVDSLAIERDLGDRKGEALGLDNLGRIALRRGEFDRASTHLERSLEVKRDIDDRKGEAGTTNLLGTVALRRDAIERAHDYFERGRSVASDGNFDGEEGLGRLGLGAVARERGGFDRAREQFEAALALLEDHGTPRHVADVGLARARLARARGDADLARERARRVREAFADLGKPVRVARSRRLLGRLAADAGSPDAAREHWEAALETFRAAGARHDSLGTLEHLVEACRRRDDLGPARDRLEQARTVLDAAPESTADLHREWVRRHRAELDGA